jgi:hypothetical protein
MPGGTGPAGYFFERLLFDIIRDRQAVRIAVQKLSSATAPAVQRLVPAGESYAILLSE